MEINLGLRERTAFVQVNGITWGHNEVIGERLWGPSSLHPLPCSLDLLGKASPDRCHEAWGPVTETPF